jgi:hypothetical protein
MVVKSYRNTLTIRHATLSIEDEDGNTMVVEIDTNQLAITNFLDESDYRYPDPVAFKIPVKHVGSEFSLYTSTEYVVTYGKKEPTWGTTSPSSTTTTTSSSGATAVGGGGSCPPSTGGSPTTG